MQPHPGTEADGQRRFPLFSGIFLCSTEKTAVTARLGTGSQSVTPSNRTRFGEIPLPGFTGEFFRLTAEFFPLITGIAGELAHVRQLDASTHWQSSNNVTEQRRRGRDDAYRESSDGSGPETICPVLGMT